MGGPSHFEFATQPLGPGPHTYGHSPLRETSGRVSSKLRTRHPRLEGLLIHARHASFDTLCQHEQVSSKKNPATLAWIGEFVYGHGLLLEASGLPRLSGVVQPEPPVRLLYGCV